jgi:TonB family protein
LDGARGESSGDPSDHPASETSLARLTSAPSVDGNISPDLALDIVLNEIAEQVRLSTGATGVAIALKRAEELVCRAATGSAPDLDARLDPHSGLSGMCSQSRNIQHCDDTEIDSRVDVAACRILRIRSILVAPMFQKGNVIGLIEAFAASPNHFTDRDSEILVSFCLRVVNTIESMDNLNPLGEAGRGERSGKDPEEASTVPSKSRARDRWTLFLTAAVVAVALFVGWMVGRVDKNRVAVRNSQPARIQNQPARAEPVMTVPGKADAHPESISHSSPSTLPASGAKGNSGDLVVYKNGKEVFRETPALRAEPGKKNDSEAIVPATKTDRLAAAAANQYVTRKVEPRYPDIAREQHIEGQVLLKVLVGRDGGVQQVQVLSGDPQLSAAAAAAVVQWKFAPVLRLGQPVEFETQVSVDFRLP